MSSFGVRIRKKKINCKIFTKKYVYICYTYLNMCITFKYINIFGYLPRLQAIGSDYLNNSDSD